MRDGGGGAADHAVVLCNRGGGEEASEGVRADPGVFFAGDGGLEAVDPGYGGGSHAGAVGLHGVDAGGEEGGDARVAIHAGGENVVWPRGVAGGEGDDVALVDWVVEGGDGGGGAGEWEVGDGAGGGADGYGRGGLPGSRGDGLGERECVRGGVVEVKVAVVRFGSFVRGELHADNSDVTVGADGEEEPEVMRGEGFEMWPPSDGCGVPPVVADDKGEGGGQELAVAGDRETPYLDGRFAGAAVKCGWCF